MHAYGLAAVQNGGEVHVDTGRAHPAERGRSGAGDGGEARQHLEPGLQGVAQFVGVGGGDPRAEAQVVELDVLVVPGDLGSAGVGGEGRWGIDGHGEAAP